MISNQETLNLSPYMAIYDIVVPKDNMLRQINELVDFTFILEELKTKYCLDNGRNVIHDVSAVDLVERSKCDMSFKYFLDIALEDDVIDPSSLTKFRRLRLKDVGLLDMLIKKTVEIALEKNIIKSNTIIVDATHTKARYNQKSPKEFLQEKSKNVRKAIYKIDESMKDKFPAKNTTNEVKDEVSYCEKLIEVIEKEPKVAQVTAVKELLHLLKEVVEDYRVQLSYSSDEDARKCHKTADSSFFGYKTHIALSNERIITASVSEGTRKEDKFEYNKDAGRFVCKAGHLAVRKARIGKKGQSKNQIETHYFEKCKVCPLRDGCYKEGAKSKTYSVSLKSETHTEQLAFQQTDEFIQLAKERYKVEAKNSELKNGHGYDTASSAGLFGMEIQGATTIFAVNLKRILKLMNEKE